MGRRILPGYISPKSIEIKKSDDKESEPNKLYELGEKYPWSMRKDYKR